MINNKTLLLTSFLALMSSQAYAGLYVAGQAGAYGPGDTNNMSDNFFDNDNAVRATGRISAGYLWDMNHCFKLGLEAGFQGYQSQSVHDEDPYFNFDYNYQRSTLDFLGVADLSLNKKVNVFAKAGPAYVMQKHKIHIADYYEYSESNHVTVPKGAIGIGYNLNEAINLNLSLNHEFKKENDDDYAPSASSVMAGITLHYS